MHQCLFRYGSSKPGRVAIAPDDSYLLVVDRSFPKPSIAKIDLASGWVSFPYTGLPGPADVAISVHDSFALVACNEMRNHFLGNSVARIDLANDEVTFPFAPRDLFPSLCKGIAISADSKFALVTSGPNVGIKRIDLVNGTISTIPYPAEACADGVAISADSYFALVANSDFQKVGRINLRTQAVTFPYEGRMVDPPGLSQPLDEIEDVAISADDSFALVAHDGPLARIDLKTGEVCFPFYLNGTCYGVAIASDSSFAAICCDCVVQTIDLLSPVARRARDFSNVMTIEHSFCADLFAILKSGEEDDVRILVGSDEYWAHSLILKSRSPVFKAMLLTSMREGMTREINVEGYDAPTIEQLLRFMNTDTVEAAVLEDVSRTLALLQAAHHYEVSKLVAICAEMLSLSLSVETVASVYREAHRMQIVNLRKHCLEFIVQHLADVQATDGFQLLTKYEPSLLAYILQTIAPPAKRLRSE